MDKRSIIFIGLLTLSFFVINNFVFDKPLPQAAVETVATPAAPVVAEVRPMFVSSSQANESFYVLENDYQQLVFSTAGGSLAEINLPFPSKTNKKSVVLPIGFDTQIKRDSPENAQFPLHSYTTFENGTTLKKSPQSGGYTPLLRRDISSQYYACNILSHLDTPPSSYHMSHIEANSITFTGRDQGRTITKTYRIPVSAPYTMTLEVQVDGHPEGLWLTSGLLEVELVSGSYSPLIQYFNTTKSNKGNLENLKLPKTDPGSYPAINPAWVSNSNGFFGMILDPTNTGTPGVMVRKIEGADAPTRLSLIDSAHNLYPAKDYPAYQSLLAYKPANTQTKFVVYAGPYSSDILSTVDVALANPETGIGGNPHFAKVITFQGWFSFISEPFSKFMFLIMEFFHFITGSWGISIILLTFVLRVILYPLNAWAYKSNLRTQKITPKLEALKEKYKNDPARLKTEMAMFYKTERVNPLSGCLPMIIQIPFFIGMLDLLKSTFELRGVSFIPGWITNLTAPDTVFSWNYPIIFFGTGFHLLPFILGGLMYAQQKYTMMQQKGKGPLTEQQQQMNSISNIATLAFTFMFYNMSSGLNLYWIFSTLFGMIQQWFMMGQFRKNPKLLKD